MTTLELPPGPSLREQVLRTRHMRCDGIEFCARQALVSQECGQLVELVRSGERRWLAALIQAKSPGPEGAEVACEVARHVTSRAPLVRHLGDVLSSANDAVFAAAAGQELVSVLLFDVDAVHHTIRVANAGHVEPLAVGRAGGVVSLHGRGPALGLLRDQGYRTAGPLRLATGMVVLAVTDGVHDAVDGDGNGFGIAGESLALVASREAGPRQTVRRVLADVAAHGAAEEADDRTALAFSFRR